MNPNIQSALSSKENIQTKINVGERYRLMHKKIKSGSLWIEAQREAYRVKVTGEVKLRLQKFITKLVESEPSDDQGNPVWHVPFGSSLKAIICEYNRLA
ncbi:hypothetical protein N5K32_004655 [Vibrio parahaemolyticus]|nr:hypothetical protein [Vibrio parahaemolyticus]EHZ2751588.1 hypothetical protein [Vibrio parahaemolyticus]EJG2012289.1 hypothetical protein [Vibrio parahaemolyticus]EJK2413619.1 hypothetical protein [Vibrio parahaemolyticus]EJU8968782.1 hypothetical protein [Vibrio parahaemolyticus]